MDDDVSADHVGLLDADQVERDALARPARSARLAVYLYRAYAGLRRPRQHAAVSWPTTHLRAHRGSGDDGAVALDYERAIERQAEQPVDRRGFETARSWRAISARRSVAVPGAVIDETATIGAPSRRVP